MVKSYSGWMAAAAGVVMCMAATAHHSHAMFDSSKRITIKGTIEKFEFTNPHSWLKVVNDADGALWAFESNSPSQLLRKGVKASSLPAGMKVTISAMPLRDGRAGGAIVSVTRPDGSVLAIEPEAPNYGAAPGAAP